jgi:hypothetical protein
MILRRIRTTARTYQQQNILHFQVAVCHILGMTILHGLKESDTCIASFFFIVERFEHEAIQELATLDFLHHQEVVIWSLKCFVQNYNVLMIKLLHNCDFNMQRCPFFFTLIGLGGDLNSVRCICLSMCPGLDDRKSPCAELGGTTRCLMYCVSKSRTSICSIILPISFIYDLMQQNAMQRTSSPRV